jgi:hypothetical protein
MSTGIDIKKKLAILEEGANITTDATSIDFVGSGVNSSSVGGNVTVNIPGGSGTTTYYLNESVTQTPYKEFSSIATGAIEQIVPLTVSAGATSVIAEYLTPTGVPGTTQIPTGLWQFFLHFDAGATGQNWIIRPEVYKRDLGGVETLLLTLDPVVVTNMSTTTTMYVSDAVFPFTTILTTDRILVRISMQNTTGVSQTVNFRTEGNQHYSVGLTTLNQVIPTGAVTSVTGTAPIVSSGGLTPAISIPQSSATVDGYLSSSDWSVFNSKVPDTRNITINGTTQDLSADRTWTIATSIPQANTIYVDSVNGVNAATGRGDINTPYLTPEYALGNITNTGTVTATTTSTSATLTAVSDTTNIKVGQYITGTGIPYESIVVSKTINTIVLSKACTASATITATWWTIYNVMLSGNFVATGNWQKQGFIFNCSNSTISWGAFNLFNITTAQLVPFSVIGGNWNGTNSSSKFLSLIAGSANFIFKPNTFYSIGTGYSIDSNQNGQYKFNNFTLECENYRCAFGRIASFESIGVVNVTGYFYGLLEGFLLRYCTFNSFGQIETPSSVNAINSTQATYFNVNSVVKGSISSPADYGGSFNGDIIGTTVLSGSSANAPTIYNADVIVTTFTNSGHAIINGQLGASLINSGSIIVNDMFKSYTGSGSSKATIRASSNSGFTFNATLTGTSELIVLDTRFSINSVSTYSIASGCTLYNKGYFMGNIALSGTLINDGNMTIQGIPIISGLLINNNLIELIGTDPSLSISTGTYQQNGGKLICNVASSKSGLLRKTATGGKIQLIGQAYLKVANGLAPIQILSNVGTTQNVEVYSVVDNCAAGFRISNTFSDTTYGTTYAPNILVGGTMLEDTTYLL